MGECFLYAFLFTVGLGVLLSFVLLGYQRTTHKANRYLAGFLLLNAVFGWMHYAIVYSGRPALIAFTYAHLAPLLYLLGPMAYWYVRSVLTNSPALRRTDWLHFVPALLQLANVLPYTLLVSFDTKLDIARQMIADPGSVQASQPHFYIPIPLNFILRPLLVLLYCGGAWRLWLRHRLTLEHRVHPPQFRIIHHWLRFFISMVALLSFTYLLFNTGFFINLGGWSFRLADAAQGASMICFLVLYLSLLLFPAILYGMPVLEATAPQAPVAAPKPVGAERVAPTAKGARTTEAPLSVDMLEQLTKSIHQYMQEERPWLQPQFSLGTVAAALQVPQHHLSWYFNHYLGMGFPAFRNQYRVQYACSMIGEGMAATHNLEAIGQLAGFSGRTTFFRVFKEVMGMSPAEYQQAQTRGQAPPHFIKQTPAGLPATAAT